MTAESRYVGVMVKNVSIEPGGAEITGDVVLKLAKNLKKRFPVIAVGRIELDEKPEPRVIDEMIITDAVTPMMND